MFVIGMSLQPVFLIGIALKRYDGTAEIKCVPILVEHHFRGVDILQYGKRFIGCERLHQRSNLRGRVFETSLYSIQLGRLDERFVPLYIDYHIKVAPDLCARLIAAVGTTFMINGSHDYFSSECFYGSFNTFVIGSHISIIQDARYLFVYTLYHRLPPQHSQWFRRETGGCVAGRYYSQKFHI